eukprot:jgi/Chrzof1/845/Cz01g31050.t1
MKQKREREEACYTCGHYHDLEGGEPCSICGHVVSSTQSRGQHESVMPTTIVPGFLYLGSYDTASRQELLKAMNITHILNTVPTCQALYKNTFTYHTVSSAPPEFEECFAFLDQANSQDRRVLVYCMSGTSRSPTIVIGYLMKLRGWRLAESYKWVKDKRASIRISPDDTKRLIGLEMQLHQSCSVPCGLDAVSLPGSLSTSSADSQPSQPSTSGNMFSASQVQWPQLGNGGAAAPVFGFSEAAASAPFVFGAPPAYKADQGSEMET